MILPYDVIAESMLKFDGQTYRAQACDFQFQKIQILSPEMTASLETDVLYICELKTLRHLPKASFRDHCFVFQAKDGELERYKSVLNAIVFGARYALGEVINHLFGLFAHINDLEWQLQLAMQMRKGPEPLMQVARTMFEGCTLVIVDSAYNIVAASQESAPENEYVNLLLLQGYYDKTSLQFMAEMGYFDAGDKYLKPVLVYPPNICGNPVILRSYHTNGTFYSFAALYFLGKDPTLADQFLFHYFTEHLDRFFIESGFYGESMPKRQKMLDDLLNDGGTNPDLIRDRCQALRLPQQGNFRLGYIRLEEDSTIKASHLVIQLRAWSNVQNYGVFQYKAAAIVLFQDWHTYTISEQIGFHDKWNEMLTVLDNYKARIGVSLLFTGMEKLRSAYDQAQCALSVGPVLDPDARAYHYAKYCVYDMLDCYKQRFLLEDIYIPYLDLLSGGSGSNSNLVLLYYYIEMERNISLTAKKVHMHRNSVIYRLQKIQDALKLDLDDPDVRLRLSLSFRILEMLGTLPRRIAPEETSNLNATDGERISLIE